MHAGESMGGEQYFITRFHLFDPLCLNDHFHGTYTELNKRKVRYMYIYIPIQFLWKRILNKVRETNA